MKAIAALLVLLPLPTLAAGFVEARGYPTGGLVALGWQADAQQGPAWGLHLGYNAADRGDAGRHDEEEGEGFGIGAFVEQQPRWLPPALLLAGRIELYRLELDWQTGARQGTSRVTVLLPTAEIGYRLPWSSPQWQWRVAASAGAEINLATAGEAVGEGAIGLLGLRLSFRH